MQDNDKYPMWEAIDSNTARLKVPDGWIIRSTSNQGVAMIFIRDKNHNWLPLPIGRKFNLQDPEDVQKFISVMFGTYQK